MPRLRYRIVETLPDSVRDPEFTALDDRQIRLRLAVEGDSITVIATGTNVRAMEQLLATLGADEIGVDLCG